MAFSPANIEKAQHHLRAADPVMKQILQKVGPFTLREQRNRFMMLVRSILSQQISTAAAKTVIGRLTEAVGSPSIRPEQLVGFSIESLREMGISRQKAGYLLDLRDQVLTAKVDLSSIGRKSDEEITDELTRIKGIGVWTAHMFLIFSLGRLDVFPYGDLGIRASIAREYGLDEYPDREEACRIATPWSPFCTVASWYLWRAFKPPA